MFEQIFKEALGLDQKPFDDLIKKAKDNLGGLSDGDISMPSFSQKVAKTKNSRQATKKVPTAKNQTVAPMVAKPKLSAAQFLEMQAGKNPMSQGSPVKAGLKTNIQMDASSTPGTAIVNSKTGGLQRKTTHSKSGIKTPKAGGPGLYVAPGQPTQQEPALEAAKQEEQPLQHVAHQDGGTVVTGNKQGQIPGQPVLDHKARWYHDNLKVGDMVHFPGWSEEHQTYTPVNSEVTELNPNGNVYFHVKPLHKDLRDDPNAPGLPVHYSSIEHIYRSDENNPHERKMLKYAGEYQQPDDTAPKGATPQKQFSPEEATQHLQKMEELKKVKADSVKQHLQNGDYVEFWLRDPMTNKPILQRGHAYSLPTPETEVQGKGGKSGAKGEQKKDVNNVVVQTEDGPVAVNLWDIHRFGKMVVGDHHLFGFDKDTGLWKNQGVQSQAQPTEPTPSPAEMPATHDEHPGQPTIPQFADQQPVQTKEEEEQPKIPNLPHTEETSRAHTILDAGGKFMSEDPEDGVVYFSDPEKGTLHSLPIDKVNKQTVQEALGKTNKPVSTAADSFHEQEPTYDISNHWTHQMDPGMVKTAASLVDKVDQARQAGLIPYAVLQARHDLLNKQDENKAAKSILRLQKYFSDPGSFGAQPKHKTADDYKSSFYTSDLGTVGAEDVQNRLGTNRTADHYLHSKQADFQSKLSQIANESGSEQLASDIGKLDPSKDNREALKFYEHRVRDVANKANVPVKNLYLPNNEHLEMNNHLDELASMMHKDGLNIPAYQNKLSKLRYMVHNDPDSPTTHKMFNEMHSYLNDKGENDPYHQLHQMREQIGKLSGKKVPTAIVQNIENRLDNVDQGAIDPTEAMKKTVEQLKEYGVSLKAPEPAEKIRGQERRMALDSMMKHREMVDEQKKLKEQEVKEKQKEAKITAAGAPPPSGEMQAGMPNNSFDPNTIKHLLNTSPGSLTPEQRLYKENFMDYDGKQGTSRLSRLKNNEKNLLNWPDVDDPISSRAKKQAINNFNEDLNSYNDARKQLKAAGVDTPEFVPKFKDEAKGSSGAASEKATQLYTQEYAKREAYGRQFLRNTVRRADSQIDGWRSHFLSRAGNHMPDIQQDLNNLDQQIKQNLEANNWESINVDTAQTSVGRAFIQKVNENIERVRRSSELTGVPVDQALAHDEATTKSIDAILSSEKVLTRRDINLALRKSFYNDIDSPELKQATGLLAAYFDDFIDTIMTTYQNVPLSIRKSVTRKLVKSLIDEVIKDNRYAAATMQEDSTAPLTNNVIKSMGQEVATIVTEFRMDANQDKEFFVVNLTKSVGNEREFELVEKITPLEKGIKLTQDEWIERLSDLEDNMYKAGCLQIHISDHRLRKFVNDNDSANLEQFFNENVIQLNRRIEEIKKWD